MKLKVKFQCEGNSQIFETEAESGELLTQCAYRAGVTIQQTCGGTPSCTDCKIKVLEGQSNAFSPPEGPETRLLGNVYFITHERLACQAKVQGDCKIFVPRYERKEKVLRKSQSQAKTHSSNQNETWRGESHGKKEKQKSEEERKKSSKKEKYKKN